MIELPKEVIELFEDPDAMKALATVDEGGVPHLAFKGSLTILEDGKIAYAERLDSSQANKNMVRSIWFDQRVAVTVVKDTTAYQIKGRPYKCLITGPVFKEFLIRVREKEGDDADIQAVWIITPEEIRDQTPGTRIREEEEKRPFFNRHLDRGSLREKG